MRPARMTWEGALHHIMNRGIEKSIIFSQNILKRKFFDLLIKISGKYRIRVFAYCIMNNHFHLALENSSGSLSDFMRDLLSQYGQFYRKRMKTKGYVFEGRFKSTIIENEEYLMTVIKYILYNPVRKNYVKNPFDYYWSSAWKYFNAREKKSIHVEFIEDIFSTRENFTRSLLMFNESSLNETDLGYERVMGGLEFLKERAGPGKELFPVSKRNFDLTERAEEALTNFEKLKNVKLSEIDLFSLEGKRIRSQWLVYLRDVYGMKFSDIGNIPLFSFINRNTLRTLYRRVKKLENERE